MPTSEADAVGNHQRYRRHKDGLEEHMCLGSPSFLRRIWNHKLRLCKPGQNYRISWVVGRRQRWTTAALYWYEDEHLWLIDSEVLCSLEPMESDCVICRGRRGSRHYTKCAGLGRIMHLQLLTRWFSSDPGSTPRRLFGVCIKT